MPTGGKLRASAERSGGELLIRVADTGCGIPQEALAKVFDPFYTTLPMGADTGLGLSLCYSIVREHAGTIEVESTAGVGTILMVRLPVVPDEARMRSPRLGQAFPFQVGLHGREASGRGWDRSCRASEGT